MNNSKYIRIFFDGIRAGSGQAEGLKINPTTEDKIDFKTLGKIQEYAQRVIEVFASNPDLQDAFKNRLDSLVDTITSNPITTKILLDKISSSSRLSDRQKTQAMLSIMDKLSFQNPTLNLGQELEILKTKVISGETKAHAETFVQLHDLRNKLGSMVSS